MEKIRTVLTPKAALEKITAEDWRNYVNSWGDHGENYMPTKMHRIFGKILDFAYVGIYLHIKYVFSLKLDIPFWKWRMENGLMFSFYENWRASDFCKMAGISYDTFVFGRFNRASLNKKFGICLN